MLKVIKPGFFSTIQDNGRFGYQQYGVIVSGVMDQVAFRIGNTLLKQQNKAVIEMTLIGGTFQFTKQTFIVLSGGTMQATLNERPVHMYETIEVQAGDTLVCGPIQNGARGYLCIKGGFLVEEILESRSTYIKAKIGGLEGRALKTKDEIPYEATTGRAIPYRANATPFYKNGPIRILKGTEWMRFSETTLQHFLEQPYTISLEADRMGYRLQNETPILLEKPFQLISEAVTFGTIQMPPSGQPIVLMADRQTTGGYPKIGQVISADLHRLAQKLPKQQIHFELVSLEEAEAAYMRLELELRLIENLVHSL